MSRRLGLLVAVVLGPRRRPSPRRLTTPTPPSASCSPRARCCQFRWAAPGPPPYDMKIAIHDAARRREHEPQVQVADLRLRHGARQLVFYGADDSVRRQRAGLLPPRRARTGSGCGSARTGTGSTGARSGGASSPARRTAATTRRTSRSTSSATCSASATTTTSPTTATTRTPSCRRTRRTKPKAGYNAHVFGRCDVATLQQQYDVLAYTTPYSTCLDVPTVSTLSASSRSVASGAMVTFTATLTSARHRSAVEQPDRGPDGRPPAAARGSGWADVLTMNDGSATGTYTASLTIRASQDYRVLFRKPSGEGLRTDASATVPITVSTSCSGAVPPVHPNHRPMSTREDPSMSRPVIAAAWPGACRAAVIVGLVAAALAGCGTGGLPATSPPSSAPRSPSASPVATPSPTPTPVPPTPGPTAPAALPRAAGRDACPGSRPVPAAGPSGRSPGTAPGRTRRGSCPRTRAGRRRARRSASRSRPRQRRWTGRPAGRP